MKIITTKEIVKALLRYVFQHYLLSRAIVLDRDL